MATNIKKTGKSTVEILVGLASEASVLVGLLLAISSVVRVVAGGIIMSTRLQVRDTSRS